MNLCNFAKVIISRCTKDASTINWWNENVCSSDDLKLDIPAQSTYHYSNQACSLPYIHGKIPQNANLF
jgi:hypothetical protein